MLIDLTSRLPLLVPSECKTSFIARVRIAEGVENQMMWGTGSVHENRATMRNLTTFKARMEYPEGRDQKLLDFLIRPPFLSNREEPPRHCFRVMSAIPADDRKWDTRIYWFVLHRGKPDQGILPKIEMDTMGHYFMVELAHYSESSEEMASPPNQLGKQPSELQTIWDRLSDD